MCIISFHVADHPVYKLVIAANRDEFYERPTKEAHFWEDHPTILGGRDLKGMGTWLGMTRDGKIAALTNFRDPNHESDYTTSRGDIVTSFLTSSRSAVPFLTQLQKKKDKYNGFNVLVGTPDALYHYSNREDVITNIAPGTHSISNHLLNTPWPKVVRAKNMLQSYVTNHTTISEKELFRQLEDNEKANDEQLPHTGVGLELERELSPIFIQTDRYGTRSSTVILVTHDNDVTFTERTYHEGTYVKENTFRFSIQSPM